MSTTDTVEVPEVEVTDTDEVNVEGEVTGTEVAEVDATEAEAPKPKRTRKAATQDVPTPAPVEEKSAFTKAKANKHTEKMKASVQTAGELFIEAYQGRIWLALDYPSWSEYLNAELGELRPKLPREQRRELVGQMKREAKMSQPAMAEALGVDQKTVSNDLRDIKAAGQEVGTTTVGQDGREVAANQGGNRRPQPLINRVSAVFDKLDRGFGDLTELGIEPDWAEELGAIRNRFAPDVERWRAQLADLLEQFNSAPEFEESEEDDTEE